jgi:hypothetical protein
MNTHKFRCNTIPCEFIDILYFNKFTIKLLSDGTFEVRQKIKNNSKRKGKRKTI